MGRGTRPLAVLAAACVVFGAAAGTARADIKMPAAIDSLVGEVASSGGTNAASRFDGTCANGAGTFTFSVLGTASGPLGGTFSESGSFTIADGRLTAYTSRFTISSLAGLAYGTRTATPDELAASSAACGEIAWGFPNGISLQLTSDYSATILTWRGIAKTTGAAWIDYGDVGSRSVPSGMTPFQFVAIG